jgi:hypothetical protein
MDYCGNSFASCPTHLREKIGKPDTGIRSRFSLTQVLDRPVTGRVFFEEVIRETYPCLASSSPARRGTWLGSQPVRAYREVSAHLASGEFGAGPPAAWPPTRAADARRSRLRRPVHRTQYARAHRASGMPVPVQ